MQNILEDNANEHALDAVKTQEKPLLAVAPSAPVSKPSSLLQKYIDTGVPIFKEAAGHALGLLQKSAEGWGSLFPTTVTADNRPAEQEMNKILTQIAGAETGVVKGDKYTHVNHNTNGTRDFGKYQVNEATLKDFGQKYLGRKVTPAEFLADRTLQEKFTQARIRNFMKQGYDTDNILYMWHSGSHSLDNKQNIPQILAESPYVVNAHSFLK